jgi:hypothetical protein
MHAHYQTSPNVPWFLMLVLAALIESGCTAGHSMSNALVIPSFSKHIPAYSCICSKVLTGY